MTNVRKDGLPEVDHPVWCRRELCTVDAVLELEIGEHRSEELPVDDGEVHLAVQLVQDQAVGGATPRMVFTFGAEKLELHVGVAQGLIDQAVNLFYRTTSDYEPPVEADGTFIPAARKASA